MNGFKEITKREFYEIINPLDICIKSDIKEYPYKHFVTKFTYRNGDILGISTQNLDLFSDNYDEQKYYIKEV
jgi:hypothetical protein